MCTAAKQLMGWTLGLVTQKQSDDHSRFMAAVLQKGGAEGWVQVELDAIYKTLPNTAWVQREQAIYVAAGDKVDFLIKCKDGPAAAVEVKVETLFQSAGLGRVTMPHAQWTLIEADIARLATGRKPDLADQPAYAVALAWSDEATAGISAWAAEHSWPVEHESVVVHHDGADYAVSAWVFTITGD